ncbi:MAG: 2OG-Fe(II) oxygenase, partial [Cobetia amphilecti]
PEAGTFVCFLSEQIPHEVLPTHQARASVTGWFRRNSSQGNLVDPAR